PVYGPVLVDTHEVAVHLDVLQELRVLAWSRDAQVGLRSEFVDAGLEQEVCVLARQDQLVVVDVRVDWYPRMHWCHVGVDGLGSQLPCDRHAVVTVLDEVGAAYAVQLDRRDTRQARHGHLHAHPALAILVDKWQELAREVLVTTYAAHDGVEWHVL